jgi:hypothetical protein
LAGPRLSLKKRRLAIRQLPSHIGAMNFNLTDEETAALTKELHDIVENDRASAR